MDRVSVPDPTHYAETRVTLFPILLTALRHSP
jgi:hypothetical protein